MLLEWEKTDKAKKVQSASCHFSRKGYIEDTAISKNITVVTTEITVKCEETSTT